MGRGNRIKGWHAAAVTVLIYYLQATALNDLSRHTVEEAARAYVYLLSHEDTLLVPLKVRNSMRASGAARGRAYAFSMVAHAKYYRASPALAWDLCYFATLSSTPAPRLDQTARLSCNCLVEGRATPSNRTASRSRRLVLASGCNGQSQAEYRMHAALQKTLHSPLCFLFRIGLS